MGQYKVVWEWEVIEDGTARVKVMGGWIVLRTKQTHATGEFKNKVGVNIVNSESMIFIPDKEHAWQIIPPYVDTKPAESKKLAADFESPKS